MNTQQEECDSFCMVLGDENIERLCTLVELFGDVSDYGIRVTADDLGCIDYFTDESFELLMKAACVGWVVTTMLYRWCINHPSEFKGMETEAQVWGKCEQWMLADTWPEDEALFMVWLMVHRFAEALCARGDDRTARKRMILDEGRPLLSWEDIISEAKRSE